MFRKNFNVFWLALFFVMASALLAEAATKVPDFILRSVPEKQEININ